MPERPEPAPLACPPSLEPRSAGPGHCDYRSAPHPRKAREPPDCVPGFPSLLPAGRAPLLPPTRLEKSLAGWNFRRDLGRKERGGAGRDRASQLCVDAWPLCPARAPSPSARYPAPLTPARKPQSSPAGTSAGRGPAGPERLQHSLPATGFLMLVTDNS